MTSQTSAMSPFPTSPPVHKRSHLMRKLILLFLLVSALSLGLMILFRAKPEYPAWLQGWFAVITMAVAAGFGARWVLGGRHGFVRYVVALASYLVGLFILGAASQGTYGIGPMKIEFWPNTVDVDGLTQLGVGAYLILLVFAAWRKPRQVEAGPLRGVPEPQHPAVEARVVSHPDAKSKKPILRNPFSGVLKKRKEPLKISRNGNGQVKKTIKPITHADLPFQARKRPFWRGRAKVRLAVVEAHRCPYCLEPVNRTDARGVVECDICHTLHHKDCWEITGVCQVPHYNS